MSTTITLLATTIIILSVACLALLFREWSLREKRITDLEARIKKLESANCHRLPHRAADELLDAMAVLDLELSKKQIELDYLENIKGHITNAMTTGTKRQQ